MPTQASPPVPNRFLEHSQKLYQQLLRAYPQSHREEYGGAMAQLFRDQCRDAWTEGRSWGLAALWVRILPDLLKTSVLERWSNFKPVEFMSDKFNAFLNPRHSPSFVFFTVFIIMFLLIFSAAVITTYMLPELYASTVRIKVYSDMAVTGMTPDTQSGYIDDPYFIQTTFEILQSQAVLSNVVTSLNLNQKWGRKYYGNETLTIAETMDLLKHNMEFKTIRNTKLISITIYNEDKNEAAAIANEVAKSYQAYRQNSRKSVMAHGLQVLQENDQETVQKITQSRNDLAALRKKFGVVDNESFEKNQADLVNAQRSYAALQSQWLPLKELSQDQLRDILPTITGDVALSDLLGKIRDCRQNYARLTNEYAPTALQVTRVTATMDELNGEIDTRVAGIMTALQTEVTSRQVALAALQASVKDAGQNSKPTPENQPYWDQKRRLADWLDFQRSLEAKINAEKLDMAIPFSSLVEIIDYAQPGDAPVKPNKALNITLGAIAGLFLGGVAGSIAAYVTSRVGRRKAAPGMV